MNTSSKKTNHIAVSGNERFVQTTERALKLLKTKVPKVYEEVVLPFVKKIKLAQTSGMNLFAKIPTFEVSEETAFRSLRWYSSTIAHEAFHSKLYFDYKNNHRGKVPRKIYASQNAEVKCIRFQIKTAEKIGASIQDIKYLKSLDGSHANLLKIDW